jgi:hypothetical protein
MIGRWVQVVYKTCCAGTWKIPNFPGTLTPSLPIIIIAGQVHVSYMILYLL